MQHWDETWRRLREWTDSQAQSERLAAQILMAQGYTDVDPTHPLGGPDGRKDARVTRDGEPWIMAVYFPRRPKSFEEIKAKFLEDSEGVATNNACGMAFVTNQEVLDADRIKLEQSVQTPVQIFHLERITAVLDHPPMAGVREQFLGISGRPPAATADSWPTLAERDWRALGVAPAGRMTAGDDLSVKIPRQIDADLRERLVGWSANLHDDARARFVVLEGQPGWGKTRCAHDAVRDLLPPETMLIEPADSAEAHRLASGWSADRYPDARTILWWLDDLESYVRHGAPSLNEVLISRLLDDPRVLIMATRGGRGLDLVPASARSDLKTPLQKVVERADVRRSVAQQLTSADLRVAGPQLDELDDDDLAAVMRDGPGPAALELTRLGERHDHACDPESRALADVCLTWTGCGILEAIPRHALRWMWGNVVQAEPRDASFERALDWAEAPVVARIALLRREGEGDSREYRPSRPLGFARREELTAELVHTVLAVVTDQQLFDLARDAGDVPAIEQSVAELALWEEIPEPRRCAAAGGLSVAMNRQRRYDESARWLELGDALGDELAQLNRGVLLYHTGSIAEAVEVTRRAVASDSDDARVQLAAILYEHPQIALSKDEPVALLRTAYERGHSEATFRLWEVLEEDDPAADVALQRAVNAGVPQALSARGAQLGEEGRLDEALELLAAADAKGDAPAAYNHGCLLHEAGDREGARLAFARGDERGDCCAAFAIGGLALEDGDADRARAAFFRAAFRGHHGAWYELGEVYRRDGNVDGALQAYRRAAAEDASDPRPHIRLGEIHLEREQWQLAVDHLRNADDDSETAAWLGHALRRLDSPDAAQVLAHAADLGSALGAYWLGELHAEAGEIAAAAVAYERAHELGDSDAATALGLLELASDGADNPAAAKLWLEIAADASPQDAHVLFALGVAYGRLEDPRSLATFVQAAQRGEAEAAWNAAIAFHEQGDSERELEMLAAAAAAGHVDAAHTLGHRAQEADDPERADAAWQRAMECGHESSARHLIELRLDHGSAGGALAAAEQAVELGLDGAADLLEKVRSAVDQRERELRAELPDPEAVHALGVLLLRPGRLEESVKFLRTAMEAGVAEAHDLFAVALRQATPPDDPRFQEVIDAHERAVELGDAEAQANLRSALRQRGAALLDGELEGAIRLLGRAVELGDAHASCLLGKALCRRDRPGDRALARAAFAAADDGGHTHGRYELAHMAIEDHDLKQARSVYSILADRDQPDALVWLAKLAQDPDEKLAYLQRADELGSQDAAARLGELLLERLELEPAVAALRRAAERGSSAAVARLEFILRLMGDSQAALRLLDDPNLPALSPVQLAPIVLAAVGRGDWTVTDALAPRADFSVMPVEQLVYTLLMSAVSATGKQVAAFGAAIEPIVADHPVVYALQRPQTDPVETLREHATDNPIFVPLLELLDSQAPASSHDYTLTERATHLARLARQGDAQAARDLASIRQSFNDPTGVREAEQLLLGPEQIVLGVEAFTGTTLLDGPIRAILERRLDLRHDPVVFDSAAETGADAA